MQNDAAVTSLRFLDPKKPSPASLLYMGFDDAVPVAEDETCERWNGPAQEMIFHIHKRDEPRWASIVGGDPIKRKAEAGRVYILLTCPVDYWVYVALSSIVQQFPEADRRCLTRLEGVPLSLPIAWAEEPTKTPQEAREIEWLLQHAGEARQTRISVDTSFTDRFLAKLALGLSHTILGPDVSAGGYANHLRARLWNWDVNEAETQLRGTGFWNQRQDATFDRFIGWSGAWVIAIGIVGQAFGLSLSTPGGRTMSMMISDNPSIWPTSTFDRYRDMHTYVIVPQREWCIGPISMTHWIGHKLGSRRVSTLVELEDATVAIEDLPPRIFPSTFT